MSWFISITKRRLNGYSQNADRNQIAKCFINTTNIDLPKELTPIDPSWQAEQDNTLAMSWIKSRPDKPPKCLAHDPFIKNRKGQTCMNLWTKYNRRYWRDIDALVNRGKCPKWMICRSRNKPKQTYEDPLPIDDIFSI